MAKFKVGDEVFMTSAEWHSHNPKYYPPVGSYGKIVSTETVGDSVTAQWGFDSGTLPPHTYCIPSECLRKVLKADKRRAFRYYVRYIFPQAINDRDSYGSIFTSIRSAYKSPSENKLRAEREIKERMIAEGGVDYRVLYATSHTFTTAYVVENILVVDTKEATYRYDLDFCREEYKKRVMSIKEKQAKVDAALEVCRRG